jgi:hypothetical protein
MLPAGMGLRKVRDSLGLTMRDVENASAVVAQRHGSQEYLIPPSRLSDIETKGIVPSMFRFYCLAAIYHKPVAELLHLYGIDMDATSADWDVSQPASSHFVALGNERGVCRMPVKMDPGFDLRVTSDLGRMVQQWGVVPFSLLGHLASQDYTYAFIGSEDLTMYPILFRWMSRRGWWWNTNGDPSTSARFILSRPGTVSYAVGALRDPTR